MKRFFDQIMGGLASRPGLAGILCGGFSMFIAETINRYFMGGNGGQRFIWTIGLSLLALFISAYLTLKFNYERKKEDENQK